MTKNRRDRRQNLTDRLRSPSRDRMTAVGFARSRPTRPNVLK
ncbi:MAG: hypothetical protein ACP5D7_01530 [Limnospira sp.]